MGVFLLSVIVIAVAMLIMAVGVLFRYPCLRGSCGGPDLADAEGQSLRCAACPHRQVVTKGVGAGFMAATKNEGPNTNN